MLNTHGRTPDPVKKNTTDAPKAPEAFMSAAIQVGTAFLQCSGPVTRLEKMLSQAGKSLGLETSVTATPSSLNLYCYDGVEGRSFSRGARISEFYQDLAELRFVDKLLGRLASGDSHPTQILAGLQRWRIYKEKRSQTMHFFAVTGIGFAGGMLMGADLSNSLLSGLCTLLVVLLTEMTFRGFKLQPVFQEFFMCLLAFSFSGLFSYLSAVPAIVFSIGTLVYIVPGLLLTTAISEVVDQNFLSGSIRLIKASYTLMSMALAYFLVWDLVHTLGMSPDILSDSQFRPHDKPVLLLLSLFMVLCFSIEFKAHRKSIMRILFCCLWGASVYLAFPDGSFPLISKFASAFTIGLVAQWLGQKFRHPSQIYSAPCLLILVPGMVAFSSFGFGRVPAETTIKLMNPFVYAILTCLVIVMGLAFGRSMRWGGNES